MLCLEHLCLWLDGGRVNTLGNSHLINHPKLSPRYWMKIVISWRLLPSFVENINIIFHCSICENCAKQARTFVNKRKEILDHTDEHKKKLRVKNIIKYSRYYIRRKHDSIRHQLSVKLLSFFIVLEESITATFTKKCMWRISVLGFVFG